MFKLQQKLILSDVNEVKVSNYIIVALDSKFFLVGDLIEESGYLWLKGEDPYSLGVLAYGEGISSLRNFKKVPKL